MTIDLPPDLEDLLRQEAQRRGQPVRELIRAALNAFLATSRQENDLGEPRPAPSESASARRARVHSIAGKYAHVAGTVEEFLQEKHAETRRQEERDRQHRQDCQR